MAIPLVVGGLIAAAGLYKGGKALLDNSEANDINESANDIVKRAEEKMNIVRQECNSALEDLGRIKAKVLAEDVKKFLAVFSNIKNIELKPSEDLGNLSAKDFAPEVLEQLQSRVNFVLESGLGAGTGVLGGALTAFGAYSGTMALATASTGTAISALSGVAATNATLAWLGGGTLAAGGMGVAGGMMALGALTAGPALLIAGWYMGSKAESKLNDARSNLAQAKEFDSNIRAAIALTNGIKSVAYSAYHILDKLSEKSAEHLFLLQNVIINEGKDYQLYTSNAREICFKSYKIIQLIKAVIDTPILDEEGNLLGDASANLLEISANLGKLSTT